MTAMIAPVGGTIFNDDCRRESTLVCLLQQLCMSLSNNEPAWSAALFTTVVYSSSTVAFEPLHPSVPACRFVLF